MRGFDHKLTCIKDIAVRPSGLNVWPLRPPYKFLRIWWAGTEVYSLVSPQTNLLCNFSCLLNLPHTNLEGPAPSFSPCPPSIQFMKNQNGYKRRETNTILVSILDGNQNNSDVNFSFTVSCYAFSIIITREKSGNGNL